MKKRFLLLFIGICSSIHAITIQFYNSSNWPITMLLNDGKIKIKPRETTNIHVIPASDTVTIRASREGIFGKIFGSIAYMFGQETDITQFIRDIRDNNQDKTYYKLGLPIKISAGYLGWHLEYNTES